ncbi:hypothetical protein PSTG_12617 [Puccinia striiformis f. sp. tritici PST-78]|uniref:BHLH domain-containing protein n=1 Tax=Puccinia striiformis f. sp. tritici PST-78 TaxID=1165861 RepID=A0A0L0V4Z8_9BASI|nr:hypothetical protein PSTG_12617 [Puccinia striiformis f. sp. tritici PST-78]
MSDGSIQITNHACHSSEHQFIRSSRLHSPPSHTKENQPQLGHPATEYHQLQDHHNHHHQSSLGLHQQHGPRSLRLDTFDPGFQIPNTPSLGLLPIPVAYEALDHPDRAVHHTGTGSSGLQASNNDPIYQNYSQGGGAYGPNYQLSFPSGWNMSPASRDQLPSPNTTQDLILNNFLHDPVPSQQSHPSTSNRPAQIESYPSNSTQQYSNHYFPPPPCVPSHDLMNYPPPNPPTPPPLFDASEQDLLSSFLNILGDSNGECEFDPRGMPEGMPVLGELRRRLEECGHDVPVRYPGKLETDDMGRQVESRLKISEPEYSHIRRPSLQSFQTTSGSLSSSSDSHLYQDQGTTSRKKARTSSSPIYPIHLPEIPHHGVELEHDVEMRTWNRNPSCETGEWPTQLHSGHDPQSAHTNYPRTGQASEFLPNQALSLSPVFPSDRPSGRVNNAPINGRSVENEEQGLEDQPANRRAPKRAGKPGKSTHIVSEQRRRNAIQGGFGSLVEILRTGEAQSGISIANPDLPSHPSGSSATTNSSNKKPKTRGRGRRGEIETGASKSVVLERAAEFVQWMADGNFALTNEIKRLESILQNHGIHV